MITTKEQALIALIKRCSRINEFCKKNSINITNSILEFNSIYEEKLSVIGGTSTDVTTCYFCPNKEGLLDIGAIYNYMKSSNFIDEESFIYFINCTWGVIIEEDGSNMTHEMLLFMIK